jgi:hypothetical protein
MTVRRLVVVRQVVGALQLPVRKPQRTSTLFENVNFYSAATGYCQQVQKSAVECLNSRQNFVWGALLFLIFFLKIWTQNKARVRLLLRWPNVLRIQRLLVVWGGCVGTS